MLLRGLSCLICLWGALAVAQDKPSRTCRLLFLGGAPEAPEKAWLHDGVAAREVELPRMNLSPVYKLAGGARTLALLGKEPRKPEDVAAGAPRLEVGEGMTDCYLLIATDAANKVLPLSMQAIDAGTAKFRSGQMMWFNLTKNQVGGQVGSRKLAMAANSRAILDPPAAGSGEYPVNLSYRMPDKDRLYPLCETRWQHDPRSRTVWFVFQEAGVRTPRIMGFPDFRESRLPAP